MYKLIRRYCRNKKKYDYSKFDESSSLKQKQSVLVNRVKNVIIGSLTLYGTIKAFQLLLPS